jgi:Stress-induced bacterial acidophilic repeat motif
MSPEKEPRGFSSLDKDKMRRIARMGGLASRKPLSPAAQARLRGALGYFGITPMEEEFAQLKQAEQQTTPELKVEVYNEKTEQWISIGGVVFNGPDGTISDNTPERRELYIFGIDPVNNCAYIKKSVSGVDVDMPDSHLRGIDSEGFVTVATLNPSEIHKLTVKPDQSSDPRTVRFTYEG